MKERTTVEYHDSMIQLPTLPCPDKDDSWRDKARCKGSDTSVFYPERGSNGTTAKLVCFGCSVREQCAKFAINNSLRDGIFGGLTDKERCKVRNGRKAIDITLADVLRTSFCNVYNTYPRKNERRIIRFSREVIETASMSTGIPKDEIKKNLDNADDYII